MSEAPLKNCDYCGVLGKMPTFMDGETICYSCLSKRPRTLAECTKLMFDLEQKNEALQQRVDQLEKIVSAAKDVDHNNTGSGWSNSYLDDALDQLHIALAEEKFKRN